MMLAVLPSGVGEARPPKDVLIGKPVEVICSRMLRVNKGSAHGVRVGDTAAALPGKYVGRAVKVARRWTLFRFKNTTNSKLATSKSVRILRRGK